MLISHTNIRHDVIHTELANAKLDPDGQVFPWRDLYPLAGQSVYADCQFWTVAAKESGVLADNSHVQLCRIGQVNGDERETLTTTRGQCRPVTWTQDDETVFGSIERCDVCSQPAHATETDDSGQHAQCK